MNMYFYVFDSVEHFHKLKITALNKMIRYFVFIVLLLQIDLVKSSESATRNKRLVLHSEVDIAKELQDLKQEIAQLKTVTIHDLKEEIVQLNAGE